MVIGVSGGSVAAAHLERFDSDFLVRDFQSRIIRKVLSPSGLRHVSSPWFGRGNILADQLDAVLFRGATFGRLGELEARPYLMVGATDLSSGAAFDFTSDQFAVLCSSIDEVPLSFAVAASSSVPLLFSPLSVQVHRDGCGIQDVAQVGGIGAVLHALRESNSGLDPLPQHIVFIAINSERQGPLPIDQRGEVPSTFEVASAMINGGLGRASRETGLVFKEAVEKWRGELEALEPAGRHSDIFAIEINLSDLQDPELRTRVLNVPTAFRVSSEDLAALRQAARLSVADSNELKRFLSSVAAP